VGHRAGEGSGGPGQEGYPATQKKPAYRHEALMTVSARPATKRARAFHTDMEGHTSQYAARVSEDGKAITFLSDVPLPGPRLTYVKAHQPTSPIPLPCTSRPEHTGSQILNKRPRVG